MNAQTVAAPADDPETEPVVDLDTLGDIDSLFEEKTSAADTSVLIETPAKPATQPNPSVASAASVISSLKKKGFSLNANYSFTGGVFPGWDEAPWYWDEYPAEQTSLPGLIMTSSLGLNYQLSDTLGVKSSFSFSFPAFAIAVDSFYLDYSIYDKVFLRAGKFSYNWGISRDFPFANLLSLVPTASQLGTGTHYVKTDKDGKIKKIDRYTPPTTQNDVYTVRLAIPVGIGGLEFVAIAHYDFFNDKTLETNIQRELVYWGGKYNLAFKMADINAGFMYSEVMPLRVSLSVKTTILNTELYVEGLAAIGSGDLVAGRKITEWVNDKGEEQTDPWTEYSRERKWEAFAFSGSIGFARDFFSKKLSIGSEFFYNGESDLQWMTEADIEKGLPSRTTSLLEGSNLAVNLSFKPGWHDLRFAVKFLYGINDNTMQLVPGIRIVPFPNMAVSLAVPMALGSRDGYYYQHNTDTKNRPFSVALAVTFSGSHSWDNYK
ncbi:MAG: hypothetical protein LBP19_08105 [Treponema sp.]|nr:hypothetical protein [Treponema sp.]